MPLGRRSAHSRVARPARSRRPPFPCPQEIGGAVAPPRTPPRGFAAARDFHLAPCMAQSLVDGVDREAEVTCYRLGVIAAHDQPERFLLLLGQCLQAVVHPSAGLGMTPLANHPKKIGWRRRVRSCLAGRPQTRIRRGKMAESARLAISFAFPTPPGSCEPAAMRHARFLVPPLPSRPAKPSRREGASFPSGPCSMCSMRVTL